jgi:hypothetical protein
VRGSYCTVFFLLLIALHEIHDSDKNLRCDAGPRWEPSRLDMCHDPEPGCERGLSDARVCCRGLGGSNGSEYDEE